MASKFTKDWKIVRDQRLLNDERVATYERLMDAQEQIAQARWRRGETDARIDQALRISELSDLELEAGEDLYMTTLARYVAALGGHLEVRGAPPEERLPEESQLEVRAVFPEETITLTETLPWRGPGLDPPPAST